MGAWRAAAGDYAKALDLGAPASNPAWWGVPQLLLYANDETSYEKICAAMSQQLKENEDSIQIDFAARSLCLRPLPPERARRLAQRTDKLLESPEDFGHRFFDHHKPGRKPPGGWPPGGPPQMSFHLNGDPGPPRGMPGHMQRYTAGLAHYRAGNLKRALELLEQATDTDEGFGSHKTMYPVLAMVYYDLGRTDEANQALKTTEQSLDKWISDLAADSGRRVPMPWFAVLECYVLFNEATLKINQQQLPPDARLAEREKQALKLLAGE